MLFNSSVYISRHPVRLADKNCDVSVITLYGVFFYCPSDRIRDSPFAANLASLPRLPINTSYASSTSINISGIDLCLQKATLCYATLRHAALLSINAF